MARSQSPGYPNFALPKGIEHVRKIFSADRRNPIDREVAAKHLGYSGLSGASDKVLGSLGHYGLLEKSGKGQVRVTQTAVDILHPVSPSAKKRALQDAAFSPSVFADIQSHFSDGLPSETALKSWLMREDFLDRAILPVTKAYLGTCQYLEQEQAIESGGPSQDLEEESQDHDGEDGSEADDTEYGGAKVGDLVQWVSQGALQFQKPLRVRHVTEDGQWLAVEGSETGIPMSQVIVETKGAAPSPTLPPPIFKLDAKPIQQGSEVEWMRNRVGRETTVSLMVEGKMGPKEIGKLITLLQAQKAVLDDDEEEDEV